MRLFVDDDDDNDEDGIVGTDGVERCNSIDEERLSQLPVAKLLVSSYSYCFEVTFYIYDLHTQLKQFR